MPTHAIFLNRANSATAKEDRDDDVTAARVLPSPRTRRGNNKKKFLNNAFSTTTTFFFFSSAPFGRSTVHCHDAFTASTCL